MKAGEAAVEVMDAGVNIIIKHCWLMAQLGLLMSTLWKSFKSSKRTQKIIRTDTSSKQTDFIMVKWFLDFVV